MKTKQLKEHDFVEETRRVRDQLEREFASLDAYCEHLQELDRADPKTNSALLRTKKRAATAVKPQAKNPKRLVIETRAPRHEKPV